MARKLVNVPPVQEALLHACIDGDLQRVKAAIEAGADLEYEEEGAQRPADLVAARGHTELFRFLLARGVAVRRPTLLEAATHDHAAIVALCLDVDPQGQRAALQCAVRSGSPRTLQYLLDHGADLHARTDDGATLFHLACASESAPESWLDHLAQLGARIDEPDAAGSTPLWAAAHAGRTARVVWLLAHGANPNARTTAGASVYESAASELKLLAALRDAGAIVPASMKAPAVAQAADPFAVGATVRHPKFGVGEVVARDGVGEQLKLTIAFGDGKKVLLARFVSPA